MRCRSCTLCSSKLGSEVQQQCRNVSGDIGTGFRSRRWPVSVTGHRWKTKTQRYHNQPDSVCTHKASDTGLTQQSQKNTLCWTGQGKQNKNKQFRDMKNMPKTNTSFRKLTVENLSLRAPAVTSGHEQHNQVAVTPEQEG